MKKLITVVIALVSLFALLTNSAMAELYPSCGVVMIVDRDSDIVMFKDIMGRTWKMRGCEDWYPLDFAALMMDDNGTPYVKDDRIVRATYQRALEDWAKKFPYQWGIVED